MNDMDLKIVVLEERSVLKEMIHDIENVSETLYICSFIEEHIC